MSGIVTAVEKKPQKREAVETSILTQPGQYKNGVLYVNPKLLGRWRVCDKQKQ